MTFRDGIVATKYDILNLEIKGDFKVIIDCYNKKCSLPSLITLLIEDIWKFSQDLIIYNCCHIYRKE